VLCEITGEDLLRYLNNIKSVGLSEAYCMLAPDRRSNLSAAKYLHFLALRHVGQNSCHREEWRNYVTVNLCICAMTVAGLLYLSLRTDANADPRQCPPDTPNVCNRSAICSQVSPHVCACNPASSYRCICNQGYIGDGLNCTGELQPAITENSWRRNCHICNLN